LTNTFCVIHRHDQEFRDLRERQEASLFPGEYLLQGILRAHAVNAAVDAG
jgi:hypothetical protein